MPSHFDVLDKGWIAVAFLLGVFLFHRLTRLDRRSLPPTLVEPRGFTGNKIPDGRLPWLYWQELASHAKTPIFTWWLGQKPLFVINGYAASQEIMEKHSGATADRPRSIMAGEIMSGGKRILLVQYGERWRRLRKALHQGLSPKMATSYQPIQARAALTLIADVLRRPQDFQNHAKKYAASVVMSIAYGKKTPTTYEDPEVQKVNECLGRVGFAAQPGRFYVDSGFPWLRFLPGSWKSLGKAWHKEELALFSEQLDTVRRNHESECFSRGLLDHQQEHGLSDAEAAYVAGSILGAGSDTTAAAIAFAIMAMAVYPDACREAQAEIDRVIGRQRVPTFDDQSDLPYVQAWIKEMIRWRPVSAGGFLHALTEDVHYQGYILPKGSAIVGNHYAIMHDESVFPEPDAFRPDRWFSDDEKRTPRTDLTHVQYGFGRRVCIGKNVADRSVFINVALLLWAFDIKEPRNDRGETMEIDTHARTNTANSHPLPFKVDIKPRFEEMEKILEEALRASA